MTAMMMAGMDCTPNAIEMVTGMMGVRQASRFTFFSVVMLPAEAAQAWLLCALARADKHHENDAQQVNGQGHGRKAYHSGPEGILFVVYHHHAGGLVQQRAVKIQAGAHAHGVRRQPPAASRCRLSRMGNTITPMAITAPTP